MADISKEINDFKNAIYGEEVRGSMITLAEKVNTEVETNTTNVNAAVSTANTASGKANQTLETAQEAIDEAETTLQAANTAKADAQSSAEAAAASASAAEASKTATAQSAAEAEQVAEGLGGFNGSAASVTAVDTQGMVVETGENTNAQALFNALALKVAQELVSNEELAQQLASYVAKTDIVQTESTATNKVPSSAYLKTVKDTINSNLNQKANSSELTKVSNVATAANGKVELSGGPIKIIAYAGDGNWSFQQQYGDGVILSLGMNDTQIFYDYYDGKTWTRKWTK